MSRFFSAGEELLVESDEAQKGAFVINNVVSWKEIAAFLHEELLKIDPLFSEMNIPISKRKSKAFDLTEVLHFALSAIRSRLSQDSLDL